MDNLDVKNLGKGLHLAHFNVRSLMGKLDEVKGQISRSGIDIFTISETWLTAVTPDQLVNPISYNTCRYDRKWGDTLNNQAPKKGGGLAVFIKQGIRFSDSKFAHLNTSCKDLEMQWISISLDRVRPIVIVNIYRPPQGSYKEGCRLIGEAFNRANTKDNTEFYMLGDFNINFKDSKSPAFKELDFTTKAIGLSQLIKEPTRLHFSNGVDNSSILDLIFTNSDYVDEGKLLDINISDHIPVMVTRKKSWVKPRKLSSEGVLTKIMTRKFFKITCKRKIGKTFTDQTILTTYGFF